MDGSEGEEGQGREAETSVELFKKEGSDGEEGQEIKAEIQKEPLEMEGTEDQDGQDDGLLYTGPSRQYMHLVVLEECHNNPGTGNHCGVRGTQNRVIAGYYWSTIIHDVKEWVTSCHRCQVNDPIKTVAPVLHSIKVKEAW
ncbi:uncharacterized protein LOC107676307 [Tachysurus ichikawai]